jgi:hypothetical protein
VTNQMETRTLLLQPLTEEDEDDYARGRVRVVRWLCRTLHSGLPTATNS